MADYQMPSLQRDLALIGGGIILVSALIGVGIGIAVDVLWRRHG